MFFSHFTRSLANLMEQKSSRCPFKIITSQSLDVLWNKMPHNIFEADIDACMDDKNRHYYYFFKLHVLQEVCHSIQTT